MNRKATTKVFGFQTFINCKYFLFILFAISQISLFAQNRTISGTVSDQDGSPLPGATVTAKGTTTGTITDIDGKYSIGISEEVNFLIFSFVGFEKEEIPIENRTNINAQLKYKDVLDEIVVVGYGTQKKSDVTGALVSVRSEAIEQTHTQSIAGVMQGRTAGVEVISNSGSPGSSAEITIRGISSINAANPLWVVDGVPTSGDINPLDIESIEILKDASATAIYGTKGAGGVILITTKQGKAGKMSVNYENTFSFGQLPKKIDLCTAKEWAKLRTEAYGNAGLPAPASLEGVSGAGTDWQSEVTRRAFSQNHFVSFGGGSEKLSYYMSVNHNNSEGIVYKTDDATTAVRLNTSAQITDWLKVGENFSFSSNTNHSVNEDDEWNAVLIQALAIDPITRVRQEDGSWEGSVYNTINNPVAHIDRTHVENKTYGGGGNLFAEISFLNDFKLVSRLGVQYNVFNTYDFQPTFFVKTGEENSQSSVARDFSESKSLISSTFLTWNKTFGQHNITLMVGNENEKDDSEFFGTIATNLISEAGHHVFIDNASNRDAASSYGSHTEIRHISYFGRLNYNYASKYFITSNFRQQSSSLFGADQRKGSFPSISLGWAVSKENFFNIPAIDNLKLRLSYGKTGNDQGAGLYAYTSISASGRRYVIGNSIVDGVSFPRIKNTELHWEEKSSTNIGLDMAFLNNSLTLTADYFIEATNDMVFNPDLPGHVGSEEPPYTNVASLENKGFEFELGYKNSKGELKYDIQLTFSHVKNEVTKLGSAESISRVSFMQLGYISHTIIGQPAASFYGYITDGLFQNQAEVDAHVDTEGNLIQPNAKPGDIRYVDADKDGKLDMDIIGNPFPDFSAGLNLHCEYKGFDLSASLYGVYGKEIFNANRFYTHNSSVRYNVHTDMKGRWMIEGDTNDPNLCRLNLTDANNSLRSDRFVEDGSYLRLKNLQIGYTLPNSIFEKIGISNLKIFAGAQNLFTLTKYTGYDPEVGLGYDSDPLDRGIDRVRYPNPRTIYFGLNIKI